MRRLNRGAGLWKYLPGTREAGISTYLVLTLLEQHEHEHDGTHASNSSCAQSGTRDWAARGMVSVLPLQETGSQLHRQYLQLYPYIYLPDLVLQAPLPQAAALDRRRQSASMHHRPLKHQHYQVESIPALQPLEIFSLLRGLQQASWPMDRPTRPSFHQPPRCPSYKRPPRLNGPAAVSSHDLGLVKRPL